MGSVMNGERKSDSDFVSYFCNQGIIQLTMERPNPNKQIAICRLDNQELCGYHVLTPFLDEKYKRAIWAHLTLNHQEILVMAILGDKQCQ